MRWALIDAVKPGGLTFLRFLCQNDNRHASKLVITSEMRHKRKTRSGATYHVVARANRREFILADETIKQLFLDTVQRAKRKYAFSITNMCILDNHFHLMITPAEEDSISDIMRWILSVFAMAFNREHGYTGHVWYDRFKSKIIGSLLQFIATFNYISENPIRAGIVDRIEEYRFGGYALLRDGPPGLIAPPSILAQMLFSGPRLGSSAASLIKLVF